MLRQHRTLLHDTWRLNTFSWNTFERLGEIRFNEAERLNAMDPDDARRHGLSMHCFMERPNNFARDHISRSGGMRHNGFLFSGYTRSVNLRYGGNADCNLGLFDQAVKPNRMGYIAAAGQGYTGSSSAAEQHQVEYNQAARQAVIASRHGGIIPSDVMRRRNYAQCDIVSLSGVVQHDRILLGGNIKSGLVRPGDNSVRDHLRWSGTFSSVELQFHEAVTQGRIRSGGRICFNTSQRHCTSIQDWIERLNGVKLYRFKRQNETGQYVTGRQSLPTSPTAGRQCIAPWISIWRHDLSLSHSMRRLYEIMYRSTKRQHLVTCNEAAKPFSIASDLAVRHIPTVCRRAALRLLLIRDNAVTRIRMLYDSAVAPFVMSSHQAV